MFSFEFNILIIPSVFDAVVICQEARLSQKASGTTEQLSENDFSYLQYPSVNSH